MQQQQHFWFGVVLGCTLSLATTSIFSYWTRRGSARSDLIQPRTGGIVNGVVGLIGNTPLVRINSLSDALGVEILGKAEFLNPGGSVKDRVALKILEDAENAGNLRPYTGSRIFEGTVGSTGISLTMVARARGYDTTIILPDDVAAEKEHALLSLGAEVEKVRPASIVDKKQFVNEAKNRAHEFDRSANANTLPDCKQKRAYFADQFESRSNFDAHYNGTGPEIWTQTNGRVDAFVSGAGTGGTIAGTAQFLKNMNEKITVALADPEGSGLYNKVKYGVMFDSMESEGTKRRHQVDTVVEGIGLNRLTRNVELAFPLIDNAFRITDVEAVAMSRYLVRNDGLFLGSSSACNLFASIKLARAKGWRSGEVIVTVLCDAGSRHHSKFWNDSYLANAGISVDTSIVENALRSNFKTIDE